MNTGALETDARRRPTREEALAIAAERKAARRRRTHRIRRAVAIVAVAAFIGPFAVIYTQLASGRDPALATTNAVVATADSSGSTGSGSTTTASTSADDSTDSDSTDSESGDSESTDTASTGTTASTDSASTSSPAAVTTQQS